jgi:hypothetical protein
MLRLPVDLLLRDTDVNIRIEAEVGTVVLGAEGASDALVQAVAIPFARCARATLPAIMRVA